MYVACFSRFPIPSPLYYYIFYIVLSLFTLIIFPLFLQFSVTSAGAGAGAGFFWRAGLVAGLQVGRALGCSGCLGLGSAVPVPIFLGTQPPYATKAFLVHVRSLHFSTIQQGSTRGCRLYSVSKLVGAENFANPAK